MNMPQIAGRLREQMEGFLGNVRVGKTARRFCLEALYGIISRGSVRLSEIARSLEEEIPLIKTENRLSRQAQRQGLWRVLTDYAIARAAPRVGRDTLLVVDPSDLTKKYGRKMEYLAQVRDGSEKKLAEGYWLCQIVAVECGGQEITPLVNHLWSQEAPEFRSENDEILGCMDRVRKHLGAGLGIWVMDRGGDRGTLIRPWLERGERFVVRLLGNRHLLYRGRAILAYELARDCPMKYIEHITRIGEDGRERILELSFGMREVRFPGFEDRALFLVVLRGFGEEPLMILTTEPLRASRQSLWRVVEIYLTRWRIEDTLRYAKQSYALEDVRVLGYESLRNMMALALLAMSFTMAWLGAKTKLAVLCHHALKAGKRLWGIPDFLYYTLADGLREILSKSTRRPFPRPIVTAPSAQLELFQNLGP